MVYKIVLLKTPNSSDTNRRRSNVHMMTRFFRFSCLVLILAVFSIGVKAALVETTRGPREGRVIVRESAGREVVTVITKDNRLFQFYARDVKSVSAAERVLIGQKTILREQPEDQAVPVAELLPGLEVKILEDKEGESWIKAAAWTGAEGWIHREVLTDRVEFTEEGAAAPAISAPAALEEATPAAASPPQAATISIVEPAEAEK